jgi:endonuclease/exonuclease/phosphatase family metal-dependent hydrolase
MKNYMWRLILTFYGILFLLSSSVQAQQNAAKTLTIMSFNVRYNTPKDSLYPWQNRKEKVAEVIASNKVDIAGLQEPWFDQITDLEKLLPDYAWIGWSRDDGKTKGEFTPVFYLKDKFEVLDKGVFWLSSTPEKPGSIGWDEKLPRTVIRILFREKSTNKQFWFFNTHLGGNIARTEGAKLLKTTIDEIAGDLPVIVTGDFNSKPESEPVQIMLDKNYRIVLEDGFNKALKKNDEKYTDYWFDGENTDLKRIDYIFVNQNVKVLYHEIINKRIGKYYPSDHLAIKAEVEL